MRNFKFRVWDILNRRMLKWGDIFNLQAWEIFPGTPEQRAFKVMQYTGLKDINGVEVYEGDILQDKGAYICVVRYKDFQYVCEYKNFIEPLYDMIINWNVPVKVIGNIFENPELLEERK